ncbi:hypothetical protein FOYG_13132 [Fusarium oxysporum NRRL 32931]|uniref:Uncharacterized protein n=1 Tax=Fusarium oxysporum NRRL 32931 TaxID=660029 RepID=W9HR20_FUSOX|nr:hypothetical protein FOYG_13132 [Fusarium oxysporum NRRL 32931]
MAAPVVRGPGGRLVQEGAGCTFEDDPFSSK